MQALLGLDIFDIEPMRAYGGIKYLALMAEAPPALGDCVAVVDAMVVKGRALQKVSVTQQKTSIAMRTKKPRLWLRSVRSSASGRGRKGLRSLTRQMHLC